MLVIYFIFVFFVSGNCEILITEQTPTELVSCVTTIMQKYFKEPKQVAFTDLHSDGQILRSIHNLNITSVYSKIPLQITQRNFSLGVIPYLAYVIVANDVLEFMDNIFFLNKEPNWNPYARFFIIIKSFRKVELRSVFDTFLSLHVNYVVVANGTAAAELYTYNPYENYACGKYYSNITRFGKCLDVTANIYPAKVLTGLRKCSFNVSVPHWPPFGIDPKKAKKGTKMIGTEQYIFHLISEIEQFKYKFNFDYDPESFSTVTNNMSISGPMLMLQNNLTDVMLGGLLLIPSRANIFFSIYGHLDQVDEIRVMVKKAGDNPPWKTFYLEFTSTVWALLLLSLVLYWALIVVLLRKSDKGVIIMTLLDNLLSHGPSIKCRQSVKLVFIVWVWSAYLVNSFYLTSLVSLTTKPSLGYQIEDEKTLMAHGLTPCLSNVMNKYRRTETNHGDILNDIPAEMKGCERFMNSIRAVGKSEHLFTIALYSIYFYNRQKFCDRYGRSPVYSFRKPYTKVIYAIYFQKGFPMYERLHALALRIRETGLSDKSLNDHFFSQNIRYHYHSKGYKSRFAIPWYVYSVGLFISSLTFVVEVASRFKSSQKIVQK